MLPTPLIRLWSSRARFSPVRRRRSAAANRSSSNAGSSGSRAMWATGTGTASRPSPTSSTSASPPKVRWSTKRSSWSSSRMRTRRWVSSGASGGRTSSWPLMPRWASRASPAACSPSVPCVPSMPSAPAGPDVPAVPSVPPPASSGTHRYLPRRWATPRRRPTRRARKSAAPGPCRRTARGWRTSTSAMRRPVTHASRPRRTTSTSGSSGTSARGLGLAAAVGAASVADGLAAGGRGAGAQRPPRRRRRLLLGFLLAAAGAAAVGPAGDVHHGGEHLLVVGPGLADGVVGHAQRRGRRQLLQAGLPVEAGAQGGGLLDQGVEEPVHEPGGLVEPEVEVDRAQERLEGVGEDRVLVVAAGRLLAAAQPHEGPEPELAADLRQSAHVDHGGPQLGQLTLRQLGVVAEKRVGDDQAEHGVAEELQPLVGGQPAVLVGVGPVGQRAVEQRGVDVDPETLAQHLRVGAARVAVG